VPPGCGHETGIRVGMVITLGRRGVSDERVGVGALDRALGQTVEQRQVVTDISGIGDPQAAGHCLDHRSAVAVPNPPTA
jgi:hypothetical protein